MGMERRNCDAIYRFEIERWEYDKLHRVLPGDAICCFEVYRFHSCRLGALQVARVFNILAVWSLSRHAANDDVLMSSLVYQNSAPCKAIFKNQKPLVRITVPSRA